jgi:hypothetical protein
MRKINHFRNLLLLIVGLFTFVSCGNSSEKEAETEKARQDSIAEAQAIMEQAKEEARKQASDDSSQQSEAAQAQE